MQRPGVVGPAGAAVGLVIAGLLAQELGAAFAFRLFSSVGPFGAVLLRLGFSAIILMVLFRPRLRGRTRGDWFAVVAFGVTLALMNSLFYSAIQRIPLGVAVAIELIGPLVLSVVLSRRALAWGWAILALGGAFLLGESGAHTIDIVGVLLAMGAGAAWVAYILLSSAVGRRYSRVDGLAIAMIVGAVCAVPLGISTAGFALLGPPTLLVGALVAVLSSGLPYALELLALRRIPSQTFAVLLSLAPAVASLAGLLLLAQSMGVLQVVGLALVVLASVGAVRTGPGAATAAPAPG